MAPSCRGHTAMRRHTSCYAPLRSTTRTSSRLPGHGPAEDAPRLNRINAARPSPLSPSQHRCRRTSRPADDSSMKPAPNLPLTVRLPMPVSAAAIMEQSNGVDTRRPLLRAAGRRCTRGTNPWPQPSNPSPPHAGIVACPIWPPSQASWEQLWAPSSPGAARSSRWLWPRAAYSRPPRPRSPPRCLSTGRSRATCSPRSQPSPARLPRRRSSPPRP